MKRNRLLAALVAAALVLALAGGAVLAAEGKAEKRPTPERAGTTVPEKKPAPRGAEKPFGRAVEGLLVPLPDGYALVSVRQAYRVVPGQGVDLSAYALKFVVARVAAQDGKWVVVAVRKSADLRFVQPPAPKAEKPETPQPPQASGQ